jgi:hypothetical protein
MMDLKIIYVGRLLIKRKDLGERQIKYKKSIYAQNRDVKEITVHKAH